MIEEDDAWIEEKKISKIIHNNIIRNLLPDRTYIWMIKLVTLLSAYILVGIRSIYAKCVQYIDTRNRK